MLFIFNTKILSIHGTATEDNATEPKRHNIKHNKLFTYKWTWYFRNNEDAVESQLKTPTRRCRSKNTAKCSLVWHSVCMRSCSLGISRVANSMALHVHAKWSFVVNFDRYTDEHQILCNEFALPICPIHIHCHYTWPIRIYFWNAIE